MTISKRIKSALITLGSLAMTAIVAVVVTPEWSKVVMDAGAYLAHLGVPASLIAVGGVMVAEIWKAYLNKRILDKASNQGIATGGMGVVKDLY